MRRAWVLSLLPLLHAAALSAQQTIQLPERDRALAVEPVELFRVGGAEGTGWQEFARVTQMAFDAQGNLYVLDPQSQRVVVIDPRGGLVRTHELQGDGPGEFRTPVALSVTREGELVVFDVGHMGFLRFGPDGRFLGQQAQPLEQGLPIRGFALDQAGRVVFSTDGLTIRTSESAEGPPPDRRPIRRVDLTGGAASGVAYNAWKLAAEERPTQMSGGGMRFSVGASEVAMAPGLYYGLLPGGRLAVSDSVDYAVKVVGANGGIERVLRRPIAPRRLTDADREAYKEERLAGVSGGGGGTGVMILQGGGSGSAGGTRSMSIDQKAMREMVSQQLEQATFAEERAVLAGLSTDWGGRIWVERSGRRVGEDGPIDVIDASGEYLGTVAPNGMRLPVAFGPDGRMAYVDLDDLDIPSVVVRQLPATLR
ncbi:MAG: hypothetical protein R3E10_16365 [Gemmatimonadota bacterium]